MNKCLLASLLIVGLSGPALAAHQVPPPSGLFVENNGGHPDPCWPLRLQRMATHYDAYWRDLFEACLAHYNYNN